MIPINLSNLKTSHQTPFFVVDIFMMILIAINLCWLVFDSLMALAWVEALAAAVLPNATEYYMTQVHPNYIAIDLAFVCVFLLEFVVRWLFAIKDKTYHRWFFYPFVHWYDLLGCIPIGAFRWLRLLRIFSMAYRLQRYGIVDFTNTKAGRFCKKYYHVLVEEVSDRVVENVLQGTRAEVQSGGQLVDKILERAIRSRQQMLAEWLVVRINQIWEDVYQPNQAAFKGYVEATIASAIEQERKASLLESMPVIGPRMVAEINATVSDVVFGVVDQLVTDLGQKDTSHIVEQVSDALSQQLADGNDDFNQVIKDAIIDTIDVLIDQVRLQRWKMLEQQS